MLCRSPLRSAPTSRLKGRPLLARMIGARLTSANAVRHGLCPVFKRGFESSVEDELVALVKRRQRPLGL